MTGRPDEREGQVRLPDGRALTYTCYGAVDGPVVVVLDGAGSRLQAHLVDPVAARLGLTVLAPDRPGFRGSDPDPHLTLPRGADAIASLLDALQMGPAGVLAQSLGAPFALALARRHPRRVHHLGLVGPIGPLRRPGARQGMERFARTVFVLARRAPPLLEGLFRLLRRDVARDPERAAQRLTRRRPARDQRVMRRPDVWPLLVDHLHEPWSTPRAARREFAAVARPWGFDIEEIEVPVTIWAAGTDTVHPPALARDLARRIPGAKLELESEAAVFDFLDRSEEILRTVAPPVPPE